MSYTSITGMRSNRYPLMGGGDGLDGDCGCGGGCGCGSTSHSHGVGSNGNGNEGPGLIGITVMGATAFGLLWYFGRQALQENRPRRRRRTSRRR